MAGVLAALALGISPHSYGDDLAAASRARSLPLVLTQSGPVQGRYSPDGSVRVWLGLPYAAPPVGELRWRATRPHPAWAQPLQADHYGSPCAQIGGLYGPPPAGQPWGAANVEAFGKPVGSEDCLTLNIWRPDGDGGPLPVLVFIHGGANIAGYSGDPMYDAAKLALTARAVVVTLNYRLGIFGWFLHPALQDADPLDDSGNYGLLDMLEALRFVHANIAAFGGDPGNVTLAGQSAGAISVYALLGSKLSAGLFHKAIALSGLIGSGTTRREPHYAYAEQLAALLAVEDGLAAAPEQAAKLLAAKEPAWVRDYLLSRDSARILDTLNRHPELRKNAPQPYADGTVVPADLAGIFERGEFQRMPVIVGATRDEAKLFIHNAFKISDAQRFTMMRQADPDAAPRYSVGDIVRPLLLPSLGPGLYDAYGAAASAILLHAVNASLAKIAGSDRQVYAYRFDWDRAPEPWKTVYGAAHAIDLPFVFGNFSNNFFAMDFSARNQRGRERLSRLMMQMIGAFMRSGDPNVAEAGVDWKPWSAKDGHKLILDASDEDLRVSVEK